MNNWIRSSITLHDDLNGFIQGRGTGTKTLEANMYQQLAILCHELPLQVFQGEVYGDTELLRHMNKDTETTKEVLR